MKGGGKSSWNVIWTAMRGRDGHDRPLHPEPRTLACSCSMIGRGVELPALCRAPALTEADLQDADMRVLQAHVNVRSTSRTWARDQEFGTP